MAEKTFDNLAIIVGANKDRRHFRENKIISKMAEEWRPVVGYYDYFRTHYIVSNHGNVRRTVGGKGTIPNRDCRKIIHYQGYLQVSLSRGWQASSISHNIHNLVMEAFVGPRPIGFEVNHIDGDKSNNNLWNLEYVTHKQNMLHAKETGLLGVSRRKKANVESALKFLSFGVGKLSHAFLKREQGIRGTKEEHDAAIKDAVADILIYLCDFCNCEKIDMLEELNKTWLQVSQRDWKKNSIDGSAPPS